MKHCLIVDDSNSIRKVASRILSKLQFRTSDAETHEGAVQICSREMPDCIMIDWQMPDGEPQELVSRLRQLPGGDEATFLLLMSERDRLQISRSARAGFSGQMLKPFDSDSLTKAVAAAGMM